MTETAEAIRSLINWCPRLYLLFVWSGIVFGLAEMITSGFFWRGALNLSNAALLFAIYCLVKYPSRS